MSKLYNLARMQTATVGTGTMTLGSAVSGFLTFANAGAVDGDVVSYAIRDGANSEIGTGTYNSAGPTLTRTNILRSTNSNTAISLSGIAQVFITPNTADFSSLAPLIAPSLTGPVLINATTPQAQVVIGGLKTNNDARYRKLIQLVAAPAQFRMTDQPPAEYIDGDLMIARGNLVFPSPGAGIVYPVGQTLAVLKGATEIWRFDTSGNFVNTAGVNIIDFGASALGTRIKLWSGGGAIDYGFGINSAELSYFCGTGGTHNFRVGGAAGASSMTITSIAVTASVPLLLTTPLAVLQGGTGSTTASGARTNLGVAASGANTDITSLSALTSAVISASGIAAVSLPTAPANTILRVVGADSTVVRITIDAYGSVPTLTFERANGTAAVAGQTAIALNDQLGLINAIGYNGTTYGAGRASIVILAAEAWTSTAQGTYITFNTTAPTTITNTERMRLDGAGNLGIGLTPSGTYKLEVSGSGSFTGSLTLGTALAVLQGGTGSSSASGARSNLNAAASGLNGDITTLTALASVTSAVAFSDTTNSTSTATGAIQTSGGLGVVKDIWCGGELNVTGTAWTSWTPTISGLISLTSATVQSATYKQIGKVVFWQMRVSCVSSAAAFKGFTFTPPVTAVGTSGTDRFAGSGRIDVITAPPGFLSCHVTGATGLANSSDITGAASTLIWLLSGHYPAA